MQPVRKRTIYPQSNKEQKNEKTVLHNTRNLKNLSKPLPRTIS